MITVKLFTELTEPFFFPYFDRCEKGVMSLVNVRNCIRFYQTAEELNASTLLNYCAEIIASHWVSTARRKQKEKCLQRIET